MYMVVLLEKDKVRKKTYNSWLFPNINLGIKRYILRC